MKLLKLLFLLLLFAAPVYSQGVRYDNFVVKPLAAGGLQAVSGALITVCTSTGSGTPCTPKVANIYSDEALTAPITGTGGAGTTNSDSFGNYGFYIAPGDYVLTITGSGIASSTVKLTLPCGVVTGCTVSGTTTANGDTQFKGSNPYIDVRAYGAAGDGVADDTTAIAAAMTAALAAKGATVVLPCTVSNAFKVSSTITIPTGTLFKGLCPHQPGELTTALSGSRLVWAGSGQVPVLKYFDVAHSSLDSMAVDCANIASAIGVQYTGDNTGVGNSYNSFTNFTIKGCHQGFVNGDFTNTVTTPASCQGNANQIRCYQADSYHMENFIIYGNGSDLTGEAIHVNSMNAAQKSVIAQGLMSLVNIGFHAISMNCCLRLERLSNGSMVGTTPSMITLESNVQQGPDIIETESEAGTNSLVDHSCGTSAGQALVMGNQFNQTAVIDGCQRVFSVANQGVGSTCSGTVQIESHSESIWAASGSCILSTQNSGVLAVPNINLNGGNGLQLLTSASTLPFKLVNDTAGGASFTNNAGNLWGFQSSGVTAFPKGANYSEVASCQGAGAGLQNLCPSSVSHRLTLNNNNWALGYDPVVTAGSTDPLTNKTFDTAGTGNVAKVGGASLPSGAPSAGQVMHATSSSVVAWETMKLLNCGTTSTCAQTLQTSLIVVNGGPIALVAGTLTITSLPFASSTSYVCSADDSTGINGIDVVYVSGSSVTFNGTGTDSIRYACQGN